jgi:hypothetical protein
VRFLHDPGAPGTRVAVRRALSAAAAVALAAACSAAPDEAPEAAPPEDEVEEPADEPEEADEPDEAEEPVEEEPEPEEPEPALGAYGVSAGDSTAVDAGMAVLEEGGSAVDAAIAAAFAVSVVEPFASGIGGGGATLVVDVAGEAASYDYQEVVAQDGAIPASNTGIPGFVAGLADLHADHGVLPWERLLEPAIELHFNQAIQRVALASALELRGRGSRVPVIEVPMPPPAPGTSWQHARRITLVPKEPLRADTLYTLRLPPGVYGEGPNRSAEISVSFHTYRPLQLSWNGCSAPCWASHGIWLSSTTQTSSSVAPNSPSPGAASPPKWRAMNWWPAQIPRTGTSA